ncbi:MAG: oligosaccharide flippase family protein [Candidatus Heimdallarchaeaceae archaeon]
MELRKKLVSSVFYLFLNWFSITVLSFLYWTIIGKTLSPNSYGIVATGLQIAMITSGLSMLGINTAIQKLLPEFITKKRKKQIQGLIYFSLKLTTSIIIVVSVILFSSSFLPTLVILPQNALWIVSGLIITFTLAGLTASIFYGFQDMCGLFKTNLLGRIAQVAISGLLILLSFDYLGPLFGLFLAFLIIFLSRISRITKYIKFSSTTRLNKKLVFKYSLPAFVVTILTLIFNNTQLILLTVLKTTEAAGLFALTVMIASVIPVIPNVLNQALFPITSSLSTEKKGKTTQKYLIKLVFRYSVFFVLPIAALWVFFAKYLILLFSRSEYLSATNLLPFLTIRGIFLGLGNLFLNSLYAIRKPKNYRNAYLISVLVYLPLAIVLTWYYSAYGLAVACIVSNFILFLSSFYFLKKFLKIKLPSKDLGRVIISTIISFCFILILRPYIHNFYLAAIVVITSLLIYLLLLLKLNFYLKEDLKVLSFLQEKTHSKMLLKFNRWFSRYVKRSYQ